MKDLHAMNKDGTWFAEDGMYRVAEILMSYHKENVVDYTQKYGLASQVNQPHKVKDEQPPPTSTSSVPIEETPIYKELREYRLTKAGKKKLKHITYITMRRWNRLSPKCRKHMGN